MRTDAPDMMGVTLLANVPFAMAVQQDFSGQILPGLGSRNHLPHRENESLLAVIKAPPSGFVELDEIGLPAGGQRSPFLDQFGIDGPSIASVITRSAEVC